MIILVTGGRTYANRDLVREALQRYREVGNILIQGGARGADTLAHEIWTQEFQLVSVTVPAPWDRMDKAAGQARNIHMLRGTALSPHCDLMPAGVIAFPGGPGTANCVAEAKKRGLPVWKIQDAEAQH